MLFWSWQGILQLLLLQFGSKRPNSVEPVVSDHLNGEDLLIAYGNRPTEGLFREEVYFLEENLLHANSMLRIRVAPCCNWKSFVYSERYSTYSEQRDHTMCQIVAYKTLKNNGNNKTVWPKSVHGRLWVVVVSTGPHYRALTGTILVFCSGGRLREVLARLPFVSDQDRLYFHFSQVR